MCGVRSVVKGVEGRQEARHLCTKARDGGEVMNEECCNFNELILLRFPELVPFVTGYSGEAWAWCSECSGWV